MCSDAFVICQRLVQVLTQQWMGRSGWAHKNSLSKILHFFFQFALTPIFACGHLFRQLLTCLLCGMKSRPAQWILNFLDSCYIFNSLDSPIHRCISHLSSSALILFCLMLEVFREDPDRCHKNDFNGLYPARIALIAMIGACIFKEFEDFMQVKSVRIFFKYEFWRMFRIVNHLTIILAIIIQVTKTITTIITNHLDHHHPPGAPRVQDGDHVKPQRLRGGEEVVGLHGRRRHHHLLSSHSLLDSTSQHHGAHCHLSQQGSPLCSIMQGDF